MIVGYIGTKFILTIFVLLKHNRPP